MAEPRRKSAKNELEIVSGNKTDLTATFADELMCQVLGYLSLRDKLRSEVVNHKFRGCVMYLLNNKPLALDIIVRKGIEIFTLIGNIVPVNILVSTLNGYSVPMYEFADAVRAFAAKAKFTNIKISNSVEPGLMDSIVSALNSSNNHSLSSVNTVNLLHRCSAALLEDFLVKCGKLSNLQLGYFGVRPLNSEPLGSSVAVDLGAALKDKELTHLELHLTNFNHQQMLHLFGSIKPNTLRMIHLDFEERSSIEPDIVGLVRDLAGNAWAALEDMRLIYTGEVDVVELFSALADLPKLQKSFLSFHDQPFDQFVPAMMSVFKSSRIQCEVCCYRLFEDHGPGCEVMDQIIQFQKSNLGLQVGYPSDFECLTLTRGSVTFKNRMRDRKCDVVDCVQCHSFHPIVIKDVGKAAEDQETKNMENYQLDQCRISTVVDHLNDWGNVYGEEEWKALSVETNQDLGTVTITFEQDESQ